MFLLLRSARLTCFRLNRIAIGSSQHSGIHARSFHDLDPALAEFASRANQHFIAGREEVLQAAASRPPEPEATRTSTSILGAQTRPSDPKELPLYRVAEIFGPVMDIRAHHGVQGRRQERRRTRSKKTLFFDVHGVRTNGRKGVFARQKPLPEPSG